MSDGYKNMAANIEKFDGTNWPIWSFGIHAALMFTNSWNIADGTEKRPPDVTDNDVGSNASIRLSEQKDWDKRDMQGRSLLVLTVKSSIYQSIILGETLAQNWARLSATYGKRTGLNAWVDFRTYITTTFDDTSPISTQIDALSKLRAKIVEGGLQVPENLHALVTLGALPTSFETVQSSILGSYDDIAKTTFMDVRARILAKELRQGSSSAIHAIYRPSTKPKPKDKSKSKRDKSGDKCLWCGKTRHWVDDCMAKKSGLSKEDAKDEKKRKAAVREYTSKKGKASEATVSAITNNASNGTKTVETDMNMTPTFVFYIA